MRGHIIDINNLEAFVEFDDSTISSVPIFLVGKSSIGDYVDISSSNIKSSHITSANYISPFLNNLY
ncbi:MAG: hypothetical protein KIB43_12985 [Clostridium baratii]|uniref:S1 motif domain-containing protein n=1 Tax=Clostridium baratii str. Sullivan TaxID=1415775 RepID=A0A0A7FZZ5_9CLOT|nr:hypothetical protein [Clostridium baratii]AIY84495.1 hypothetical protein U729_1231 [Clostridium baratii str. Sullivan]MBS6007859.1 hypothetical protein [Clostridium baratii]MDU1054653.1 hypothetical protein [Clostridium baratii]MDU4911444.1 hypothetical protein [Clostridium baratii]